MKNTAIRNLIARLLRHPRLVITKGDITRENVDAIVNAAKPSLMGGGGVDGAIHAAGGPAILSACKALRIVYPDGMPVGYASATTAGRLMANFVIHTVGPDRRIGQTNPELLADCYRSSLRVADKLRAKTVAFPLISSGVYGWDTDDALRIAIATITGTRTKVRTVRLVLFDDTTLRAAKTILTEVGAL